MFCIKCRKLNEVTHEDAYLLNLLGLASAGRLPGRIATTAKDKNRCKVKLTKEKAYTHV